MIIYGTKGKQVQTGSGQFHCPRCSREQSYKHMTVKRYFTLYFIPVLPIGTAGEFIECSRCGGTFDTAVLTFDPEQAHEDYVNAMRRMGVLYLLETNRCTSSALSALENAVNEFCETTIDRQEIATDVRQAQSASPEIRRFFKNQAAELSDEGKAAVLAMLQQVLLNSGGIMPDDESLLADLGKAMGLRARQVKQLLEQQ